MNTIKRNMPLTHVTLLLTILLSLAACGGGGGSSGQTDASSEALQDGTGGGQSATTRPELKISPDNELRALVDLSIEIQTSTERSFVSICPHPGVELAVTSFDYDTCMVRASLESGLRVIELPLPNHVDRLVAIVWYYETSRNPLIRTWQRETGNVTASGSIWRINEAG